MYLEFVPVKNQKFEWGRTINPFKCDCEQCDFMNCPKKNYAVKMTRKKYSVADFWNEWKNKILELNKPLIWQYSFHNTYNFKLTYEMINDFFDFLCFSFPKGTYWSPSCPESYDGEIETRVYQRISLVQFSRRGEELEIGNIEIANHKIHEYDFSERQYKLAEKIRDAIAQLKELVFEHYQNIAADWTVGWLSPDGRYYPCNWGEHSTLAYHIGDGEVYLESDGWARIVSDDEDGYFIRRHFPSAEQRNWLSLNGYIVED